MTFAKFVTFVVLKILDNHVSMQNYLNQIIADASKILKYVQGNLTFILNVLSEPSIHIT